MMMMMISHFLCLTLALCCVVLEALVRAEFHAGFKESIQQSSNKTSYCLEKAANNCANFYDCCATDCLNKYEVLEEALQGRNFNLVQVKDAVCFMNDSQPLQASCTCKNGGFASQGLNLPVMPEIVANGTAQQQIQDKGEQQANDSSTTSAEPPLKALTGDRAKLTDNCKQQALNSTDLEGNTPCTAFSLCCATECERLHRGFLENVTIAVTSAQIIGSTDAAKNDSGNNSDEQTIYSISLNYCMDETQSAGNNNTTASNDSKSGTPKGALDAAQCSCNFTLGRASFTLDESDPMKKLFVSSLPQYTIKNAAALFGNDSSSENGTETTSTETNDNGTTMVPPTRSLPGRGENESEASETTTQSSVGETTATNGNNTANGTFPTPQAHKNGTKNSAPSGMLLGSTSFLVAFLISSISFVVVSHTIFA